MPENWLRAKCSSARLRLLSMDMADEISKLQNQLEEAEADLQESLSEVNHRVEAADLRLRAEKAIKRHPIAALCAAGAAGLVLGSGKGSRSSLLGALLLGALFGFAAGTRQEQDQ